MSIRDLYPHWENNPGSNVDARQETLERDSLIPVTRSGGRIITGLWVCPGTGKVIREARYIDCDHVISIDECHDNGGYGWPSLLGEEAGAKRRKAFANDLENIICTSRAWNRKKGSRAPWGRMPANIAWWGEYLDKRDYIRKKYDLAMSPGEADAVAFFRSKIKHHEKGVNVDRVRAWFGRYFSWVYSAM